MNWSKLIGILALLTITLCFVESRPYKHKTRSSKGTESKQGKRKTVLEDSPDSPDDDPGAEAQEEAAPKPAAEKPKKQSDTKTGQAKDAEAGQAAAGPVATAASVSAAAAATGTTTASADGGPPLHCPSPCPQQCATQGCNPSCCMQSIPMPPQMPSMCGGGAAPCMPQQQMPMYGGYYPQPCQGAMPGAAPCDPMAGMVKVTVTKPEILPLPPNAPIALPPGMAITGAIPYINGVPQLPGMIGFGNAIPGSQVQSAMQGMGVPQMPQGCPSICSQQCAPSCSHQCCGPMQGSQMQQANCPASCAQQCGQECPHSCCGPYQPSQQMPQMMPAQMPYQMPMQAPAPMPMPQMGQSGCPAVCSHACDQICPRVCCGPGAGR